jgi:hypothetical protein
MAGRDLKVEEAEPDHTTDPDGDGKVDDTTEVAGETFEVQVGTVLPGGGVVTAVSGSTITVSFPHGIPSGPVHLPGGTTVVVEQSGGDSGRAVTPGTGGQFGGDGGDAGSTGPTDGGGGGGSRGGAPAGPITLPGVDTTVVEEHPPVDRPEPPTPPKPPSPWDAEPHGGGAPAGDPSDPFELDELHRHYRLRCPGSLAGGRFLKLDAQDSILFNPTNSGSCSCAIYIASATAGGQILDAPGASGVAGLELLPGQSASEYRRLPGAANIFVACSGGCQAEGCAGQLTVSNAVF